MSTAIYIARYIILSLALIFAIAVVGLSAHVTDASVVFLGGAAPFEILSIVVAPLTIVVLAIVLFVAAFRRNAVTSMIWVEVTTLSILWALWIVVAVFTTIVINFNFPLGCSAYIPFYLQFCSETTAIQGLAWTIWLLLMGYSVTLGIMACVASSRGIRVWSKSVREATFSQPVSQDQNEMLARPVLQANHQHPDLQASFQANHQQPSLQASASQNNHINYGVPVTPHNMAHNTLTPNYTMTYPQV